MRAFNIILASALVLGCVPLPDGGQDTETFGEITTGSTTEELPEGLWGECGEDNTCANRALQCVAGQEVELDQDGVPHLGTSESMCTVGCSAEIECPMGASCLEFPSQPGIGWCYLPCSVLPCPDGLKCLDLGYSLQNGKSDQLYCV